MSGTLGGWFKYEEGPAPFKRWLAFNFVGGLGILIQLSTLAALTAGVGLHYLLATGLAVEAAVLHNFLWHERWTWRDRAVRDRPGRWKRLLRFQMANGALSLGGNLVLMQVFVGMWAMNYTLANVVSITICSILNFLASDRLVFERTRQLALGFGVICLTRALPSAVIPAKAESPPFTPSLTRIRYKNGKTCNTNGRLKSVSHRVHGG